MTIIFSSFSRYKFRKKQKPAFPETFFGSHCIVMSLGTRQPGVRYVLRSSYAYRVILGRIICVKDGQFSELLLAYKVIQTKREFYFMRNKIQIVILGDSPELYCLQKTNM